MRLTQWIEEFRDDVTFSIRQLKASPAFTAVAVLTLALGIGANSAMFALAEATLLRPLPFADGIAEVLGHWGWSECWAGSRVAGHSSVWGISRSRRWRRSET